MSNFLSLTLQDPLEEHEVVVTIRVKPNSGAKILYAWAMDAPSLKLEEGVAFKVGKNTGINSLVLQIHYKNVESFIGPGEKLLGLSDSSNFDVFTLLL